MKRLIIVADHSLIVEAIRMALRTAPGFHLVGYVDGRSAITLALAEAKPDVVLVDEMQQHENAVARIREIRQEVPAAKVILLTMNMRPESLVKAVEAGAEAVISKAVEPTSLSTLVRETANGHVFHSIMNNRDYVGEMLKNCPLTPRELEILCCLADGSSNGEIAKQLWVAEPTVKFHLCNIYRKLGVTNRTEASHYAHRTSLLELQPQQIAC
jgi:DNA-binding NarL/FixJ family response regulator